ncbi:hypothetical protein RsTz2092_08520 [Deferribacterales bacterium RsTz2092]|nr:hypothetical protein AGMMS49941_05820 [Deferribacterales bacterium]
MRGNYNYRGSTTPTDVKKAMHDKGLSYQDIGNKLGVSKQYVHYVVTSVLAGSGKISARKQQTLSQIEKCLGIKIVPGVIKKGKN